jgi:hypothetical protein
MPVCAHSATDCVTMMIARRGWSTSPTDQLRAAATPSEGLTRLGAEESPACRNRMRGCEPPGNGLNRPLLPVSP